MKQFQNNTAKGLQDRQTRDARGAAPANVLQQKMVTPVSRCVYGLQTASSSRLLYLFTSPQPRPPAHGFARCPERLIQLMEENATEENRENRLSSHMHLSGTT